MPRKNTRNIKGNARPRLRSGLEKKVAAYLKQLEVQFEYEPKDSKLKYVVPEKNRTYLPDFRLPNGIIVEAKGKFDAPTREKMLLVIEQNPDQDIRILFMRDNKITKTSKTRYTDWCRKHGIKCAVSEHGHIPREWIDE